MNLDELFFPENEKPLDRLLPDAGFCSIFRRIGCIGDSLSSGTLETRDPAISALDSDRYEHSWGQYLARMTGNTVLNLSRGGMTAREYCGSFADVKGFWDPALACDAYVMALGVNDLFNANTEIGSLEDVCLSNWRKNRETYLGDYARIAQRYMEINPRAKFFFVTSPVYDIWPNIAPRRHAMTEALYSLAEQFPNAYVIDLEKYAPVYDEAFRRQFCLNTHLNACGYLLTAKMIASYIDYIIRHNMDDFMKVGAYPARPVNGGK